jgi:glycosyltransferase involved in cell wall biosynthesis
MKVLQLYNDYRSHQGGEEAVVRGNMAVYDRHGVEARLVTRSSKGIEGQPAGRARAFFSGIYSWSARRDIADELRAFRPDIVHAHNLYPWFSPSVLSACRRAGVPAVVTVHNFGLTCPHWSHIRKGEECTRCLGGREYWCVLRNCRENVFESVGYALRSAVARRLKLFHDNVTIFIALTQFARQWLAAAGFAPDRIAVLRNMAPILEIPSDTRKGTYAAFVGRLSHEKGGDLLMEAARRVPGVPILIAGDGPMKAAWSTQGPSNVTLRGLVAREEMPGVYRGARFVVVPSTRFDMCPMAIVEAMGYGLPVIASRAGGLPELVEDEVTGLLFNPGDTEDLARKMHELWADPDRCSVMGQAAWERAGREFAEDTYFRRLMAIYERAITLNAMRKV